MYIRFKSVQCTSFNWYDLFLYYLSWVLLKRKGASSSVCVEKLSHNVCCARRVQGLTFD